MLVLVATETGAAGSARWDVILKSFIFHSVLTGDMGADGLAAVVTGADCLGRNVEKSVVKWVALFACCTCPIRNPCDGCGAALRLIGLGFGPSWYELLIGDCG